MQSIISPVIPTSFSQAIGNHFRTYKHFAHCLICLTPLLVISCRKDSHSASNRAPETSGSYMGDWEAVGPNNLGIQNGDYKINFQLRSNNQCSAKVINYTRVEDAISIPLTETVNLTGTWKVTGQTIMTIFTVVDWNESYPAGTPGGGATGQSKDVEFAKYEIKTDWDISDGKFDYKGMFFKMSSEKPTANGTVSAGSAQILVPIPKFTRTIK